MNANTNTIATANYNGVKFSLKRDPFYSYVLEVEESNGARWGKSFGYNLEDAARFGSACEKALNLYPTKDLYGAALFIFEGLEKYL